MKQSKKPIAETVCLVTGVSSGIGKAIAQNLASLGYTVIGVSRSTDELEVSIGRGHLLTKKMDITDEASIEHVMKHMRCIDVVVHAAGYGIAGSAECTTASQVKDQFETNYFGVLKLNSQVLPVMRTQKSGKIIIIGSVAGRISIPFQSHYSASKFALEAHVEALRLECRPFGIQACIVEPGDTKTGFTGARIMTDTEISPYFTQGAQAVARMAKDEQKGKDPQSVANVVVKLVQRKHMPIRKGVGLDYKALLLLIKILPSRIIEFVVRKIYL